MKCVLTLKISLQVLLTNISVAATVSHRLVVMASHKLVATATHKVVATASHKLEKHLITEGFLKKSLKIIH